MTPPPFLGPPPGRPEDGWAAPGVTGLRGAAPVVLPPVSEQVAVLQQAITGQLAVDRASLPGPQALADTAGLLAAREQLDRVLLACIGDVEVRQLARAVDGATTSSWLRTQDGQAPASVATARRLVQHPALGQALTDGRLCARAAARVGQALAALRPHLDHPDGLIDGQDGQQALAAVITDGIVSCLAEAFGGLDDGTPQAALLTELAHQLSETAWQVQTSQLDRLERALVLLAEHLPPRYLPGALEQLSAALLPQQLEDAAQRAERDRRLTLTRDPDGGGHMRGRLTPEAYELLHTVLTAAMETDPGNPSDTAGYAAARQQGWLPGDGLPGAPREPQADDGDLRRAATGRPVPAAAPARRPAARPARAARPRQHWAPAASTPRT